VYAHCAVRRYLSVGLFDFLSVTIRYCSKTAKHIVDIHHQLIDPYSVFENYLPLQNPDGIGPNWKNKQKFEHFLATFDRGEDDG